MPRNNISIKKVADKDSLDKVFEVRRKVFVIEQSCPPELEWEFEDESHHFLATIDEIPAGACRWRKTDKGYKLERFAVLEEYRGKGIGQGLVKAVLSDLPDNAEYIYLHAQLSAIPLYLKFGFDKVGDQFEEAGIQHFKMVLKK